jgi:hypothetical protein
MRTIENNLLSIMSHICIPLLTFGFAVGKNMITKKLGPEEDWTIPKQEPKTGEFFQFSMLKVEVKHI